MVTIKGLIRTFEFTKNPLDILSQKSSGSIIARYRNGWTLKLTWSQFRDIRDSYRALRKYSLTQIGDDSFAVDFQYFKFAGPVAVICPIADLLELCKINQIGEDTFSIKGKDFELEGNSRMLRMVWEQMVRKEYIGDYRNQTVLDVGGFQGESAVFFALRGAKKVIIYEPLAKNIEFIKKNIDLNHVNAEIHDSGVDCKEGRKTVGYDQVDENFSINSHGSQKTEIKLQDVSKVIDESHADLAKFDIEGAETCLLGVSNQILRAIKNYIFEVHGSKVRSQIVDKFEDAGFKLSKEKITGSELSVIYFERK